MTGDCNAFLFMNVYHSELNVNLSGKSFTNDCHALSSELKTIIGVVVPTGNVQSLHWEKRRSIQFERMLEQGSLGIFKL